MGEHLRVVDSVGSPAVGGPESFARRARAFPVGEVSAPTCFPALPARTVRWPERFRGGCSFGAPGDAAEKLSRTGLAARPGYRRAVRLAATAAVWSSSFRAGRHRAGCGGRARAGAAAGR